MTAQSVIPFPTTPSNTANQRPAPDEALKAEFVEQLGSASTALEPFRRVVEKLVLRGHKRGELLEWGRKAGYSKQYVRGILSRTWLRAGIRVRKKGAGPKIPP